MNVQDVRVEIFKTRGEVGEGSQLMSDFDAWPHGDELRRITKVHGINNVVDGSQPPVS